MVFKFAESRASRHPADFLGHPVRTPGAARSCVTTTPDTKRYSPPASLKLGAWCSAEFWCVIGGPSPHPSVTVRVCSGAQTLVEGHELPTQLFVERT